MDAVVGSSFGKWTVIDWAGKNSRSERLLSCICECGHIKVHTLSALRSSKSTQCLKCYRSAKNNGLDDLEGMKFGKWTALKKFMDVRIHTFMYVCRCDCGVMRNISGWHLRSGTSLCCKSCSHKSHGMTYSSEYRIWWGMITRCANPKRKDFKNYGGRGIKVCDAWKNSFDQFFKDMGPRPAGLAIDRIDNDGHYEPGNCRWVTTRENNKNRRRSKQ